MRKKGAYGVYFIFKSMEQGAAFRISVPKHPTKTPTTGSWRVNAAASRTTTSIFTMKCLDRS
jgi:hypothetical protein